MYIGIENHEDTYFEEGDFLVNCFYIDNAETLPHWHHHLEIILVQSGTCQVQVGNETYTCNAGDFVLIPINGLHSIQPQLASTYYAVVVDTSLLASISHDSDFEATFHPLITDLQQVAIHVTTDDAFYTEVSQPLTRAIHGYRSTNRPSIRSLIKINLSSFFIHLLHNQPNSSGPDMTHQSHDPFIKDVLTYLMAHYNEKLQLGPLSDHYHMSQQHFCRQFKKHTGKTYVTFLNDYRLSKANELLQTTHLSIAEIADLTGFGNPNYFSRVYKNRFGHAPSYATNNKTHSS